MYRRPVKSGTMPFGITAHIGAIVAVDQPPETAREFGDDQGVRVIAGPNVSRLLFESE